jgi:tRNA pseudouridine38/39 synthase
VDINLVLKNHEGLKQYDMMYIEIQGSAFLWHMIRCIVAVLMLVGDKKESPGVVKELLDVNVNNCKPQYSMASDIPLNLFHCYFKEDKLEGENVPLNVEMLNRWIFKEDALNRVIVSMQEHWCRESVKSSMIYEMLKDLRRSYASHFPDKPEINKQMVSLNSDNKSRDYKKLLDRHKCPTLEDRIDYFTKKRKIVKVDRLGHSGSSSE